MATPKPYSYRHNDGYYITFNNLQHAITEGNINGVKHFLNIKSQDINKLDSNGKTPLAFAVEASHFEIIKHLVLDRHADVCKVGRNGITPLSLAINAQFGSLEIVNFLLENGAKYSVQSAFLTAIQSKRLDIITLLQEKGALVNYSYRNGCTPLTKAIITQDVAVIKYLIDSGANVKIITDDEKQYSHIMKCVENNNLEIMKILCKAGLSGDGRGECGYTFLTKATEMEHFGIVQCLIEHGANVNLVDGNQKTALAIAVSACSFRIFRYLVNSGANTQLAKTEIEDYIGWNDDLAVYMASLVLQNKKREECGHEEDTQ